MSGLIPLWTAIWYASICSGTAAAQTAATHPAGHLRTVAAQRTASPPVIDGTADEAAWATGATTESFWVSDQAQPAVDQTRVVVLFDDHALYFAFTCFDRSPDANHANQVAADAAAVDDRVKLIAAAKAETAAKFAAEKQALAEQAAAGRATLAAEAEGIADRIAGSILKG